MGVPEAVIGLLPGRPEPSRVTTWATERSAPRQKLHRQEVAYGADDPLNQRIVDFLGDCEGLQLLRDGSAQRQIVSTRHSGK
jgi:hypothetical protein